MLQQNIAIEVFKVLSLSKNSGGQVNCSVVAISVLLVFTSFLVCDTAVGACPGTISTGSLTINDALNRVGWPITYSSGTSITLSSIFLVWPTSKGNLLNITLDSNQIWSGSSSPTSALISSLTGSTTISTGQTRTLWFNFQGVAGGQIVGDNAVETHVESSSAGQARAYSFTASNTGTATAFNIYFDSGNAATSVKVGVYSSDGTNPVTLLSSGSLSGTPKSSWSAIPISSVSLTSGKQYWLVVLAPSGAGTVKFRDKSGGTSKRSSLTTLTSLPTTWTSYSTTYSYSSMSAYLTGYVSGGSTSSSDYSFRTNFVCGNSIGYPSLPTLSIIGSNTVCNAQNYWHNASVANEDSRYTYAYLWQLDSQYSVGSGKNVQVTWNSYGGGNHTLQVTQTETYGGTATYTNTSSLNVFEVPKPNPSITIS